MKQGCPLSALFDIAIEVLANMIQDNVGVQGDKCAGYEMKTSLYAVDVDLFM